MKMSKLSLDALRRALNIRDLSNSAEGHHAMQLIVDEIVQSLQKTWACDVKIHRESPIVSM
ncbi:MAG: Phenylalanyl-tRNA synthetase class IIc [candidate division TM6 bacterium GW2011_GWF2_37_49]|nr:MAG: Phenylalanyl-tRNA synthetase class IIc [candidate division TM6 bacterium GW2011_GWF2_37_49]